MRPKCLVNAGTTEEDFLRKLGGYLVFTAEAAYEIQSKSHDYLVNIVKKHVQAGTIMLSDHHSSYVIMRSAKSNLTKYGFFHFWINHSAWKVHVLANSFYWELMAKNASLDDGSKDAVIIGKNWRIP